MHLGPDTKDKNEKTDFQKVGPFHWPVICVLWNNQMKINSKYCENQNDTLNESLVLILHYFKCMS